MGGSTKVAKPDPTPTMQQQYASWLKSYPKMQGQLQNAAATDISALSTLYGTPSQGALGSAMDSAGAVEGDFGKAMEGATANDMRAELAKQIYGDLQAGSSLTDAQARELEQSVRAAQVARGITGGNAAVYQEAATKGTAGMNLANSRRDAAQSFLAFNSATKPNALKAIMGIADNAYTGNAEIMQGAVAQNNANSLQDQQLAYNAAQANAASSAAANKGLGSVVGMVGGAGLGALLAAPTGGMSLGMGAALGGMGGGMLGGGVGGMF